MCVSPPQKPWCFFCCNISWFSELFADYMQHLKNIMKCYDDKDCLSGCVWDKKRIWSPNQGSAWPWARYKGASDPVVRGAPMGVGILRPTRSESSSLSRDSSIAHFRTWCTRVVKEVDIFPEWNDYVSLCHVFLTSAYSNRGRKIKGQLISKPFFPAAFLFLDWSYWAYWQHTGRWSASSTVSRVEGGATPEYSTEYRVLSTGRHTRVQSRNR